MSEGKTYELDGSINKVVIEEKVNFVNDEVFDLLWDLSEQRDAAIKVINRLQKTIDKCVFYTQLN
jgi:hypothetical protein